MRALRKHALNYLDQLWVLATRAPKRLTVAFRLTRLAVELAQGEVLPLDAVAACSPFLRLVSLGCVASTKEKRSEERR